jgi:S-adenosylmethionine-diacylgycerolhomoserine-N-methlytransferase
MASSSEQASHRAFLNRYYRTVRHLYDPTRRYFLFGRDRVIADLLREPWRTLVEIGPGTGRNLRLLHQRRPDARYGGVDASDEMLAHAQARLPWASLTHGFAETADIAGVVGERPQRILFSYCLSMVGDPDAALVNARRALALGGEVVVVDFGDLRGMWAPLAGMLRAFLRAFHVAPVDEALLARHARAIDWGPGRYYIVARLPPL